MVLVEPVLDPAVEQQAIGRLHRIGQKAATTVHRFVVGASVEENVHKLCSARAAAMDMRAAAAHHVEAPLTVRYTHVVPNLPCLIKSSRYYSAANCRMPVAFQRLPALSCFASHACMGRSHTHNGA